MTLPEIESKYGAATVNWIKDSLASGLIKPSEYLGKACFTVSLKNPKCTSTSLKMTDPIGIDDWDRIILPDHLRYSDMVTVEIDP